MTDMERLCRAYCFAIDLPPDDWEEPKDTGERRYNWQQTIPAVTAVLTELRNPSTAQNFAARAETSWGVGQGAEEIWQAMIDAILNPEEQ